jgi:hypothetical protein
VAQQPIGLGWASTIRTARSTRRDGHGVTQVNQGLLYKRDGISSFTGPHGRCVVGGLLQSLITCEPTGCERHGFLLVRSLNDYWLSLRSAKSCQKKLADRLHKRTVWSSARGCRRSSDSVVRRALFASMACQC